MKFLPSVPNVFGAAEPINFTKNPLSSMEKWVIGGVLAAAIVGGGVWYYEKNMKVSSSASITLSPGAQTARVSIGGQLTVALPSGASWSVGNMLNGLGNAAVTVPVAGPGTYTLTWKDSGGAAQTTTLTVANS
jgi:hypothetical protein